MDKRTFPNLTEPGSFSKWKAIAMDREEKLGCFLQFDPDAMQRERPTEGALRGVPFAVKDNIAVRGYRLTCASKLLEGLVSPYTATAVRRLQSAGAVVVGKTNLDEFGMGSSTENSAFQTTRNPWDPERVCGGSSGGSAAAVAAGIVPFALGSDTGGSVRQPASFCGVYGLKPTYGSVSRFGLVAYASSLEVIGVLARDLDLCEEAFSMIRGEDPLDQTSFPYSAAGLTDPRAIGIPRELADVPLHEDVKKAYQKTRSILKDLGYSLVEISMPTLDHVVSSYYVIATAEASANLARYDSVRYGRRVMGADNPEEMAIRSRTEGFGDEVKLRILLGTYVLRSGFQDEYYLRAQRIRTAIRNDFQAAFRQTGQILMPVYPVPAFRRGSADADPFTQKLADIFTCSANLAGLPALSFPVSVEGGVPIGMQLLAPPFAEKVLFDTLRTAGDALPTPVPPGYGTDWR